MNAKHGLCVCVLLFFIRFATSVVLGCRNLMKSESVTSAKLFLPPQEKKLSLRILTIRRRNSDRSSIS